LALPLLRLFALGFAATGVAGVGPVALDLRPALAQSPAAQSPAAPSAGRASIPINQPAAKPKQIIPTTGLVTIESDLQQADNTTGVVTATGNVRILYPDQRVVATARQAQYFTKEGRVVLSGDVDVIQDDGNAVRAERVIYFVNQERLIAEPPPGQQVVTRYRVNTPAPAVAPSPTPTPGGQARP
jgi:lipopolysaccharide export system protein LptA